MHMSTAARPSLLVALLAAGALAFATAAAAAVGSWSPLGPDGEAIYGLAADPANPNLVYAATPTSVFRSSDGGDSWTFAGAGLGSTSAPGIRALALSGSAVIAGTTWEGVWRSLDEGRTWRVTTAGLPTRPHVNALVVDPRRRERVWLASWEGIFVSDDRGETWTVRNGDLPLAGGVESLAIDPANGQLYARTVSELFTSSDEGARWSLLRCLGRRCGSVVVDPADAATLFTVDGGVLRSRDGGSVWERLRVPKGGLFTLLGFHDGRLFAYSRSYTSGLAVDRLYWSADQGASWAAAAGQPEAHSIAVMASSGDTLYLGSAGIASLGGVFRSGDGGEHWESASRGLSGRWVESIAVDPQQPGVLYAQASDHLLVSEDDGASWRLSLTAPNVLVFGGGDLLVDPYLRGRVWSTTGDFLWRSDDGGHRWLAVPRIGAGIGALAADPRTRGGVWAGGWNGLLQSPNGRAWKQVRPARDENLGVVDVAVAPSDPRRVWVAGYATAATGAPLGPRLYRSGDGGHSWQRREDGLPGAVTRLALDPERPDVLFAAAGDGVFGSSDGGASWQRLPSPAAVSASPESIRWEIVASPVAPLTLYANLDGLESEVVYRSRDAGATWQVVGGGSIAPGSFGIRALAVDPQDPRRLLAGTAKRGIFTFTEP
jgi:hypothetical protein